MTERGSRYNREEMGEGRGRVSGWYVKAAAQI